eukprot:Lithocolla_globosa_v1_NODE_2567_length_1950_cov_17.572559.p2 type:complete len:309 gc:universal NODE_2567_length_1950_cov_17.572559:294-1220(+)
MNASMRRMAMAASVAARRLLILLMAGSSTPARRLSRSVPPWSSSPVHLSWLFLASVCAALWYARSLATSSVESLAALLASVLGMTRRACANSAMASCSREASVVANFSKNSDSAASTHPPPGTTLFDSRVRLITHSTSCKDRSISSNEYSLGPRRMIDAAPCTLGFLTMTSSSSETRCWKTSSAWPSEAISKLSSPSRFARVDTRVAPVARAILLRSALAHRRTARHPLSIKSLRARSSMPLVVRMTFAPEERIFSICSRVMSASRRLTASIWSGSVTTTLTPSPILARFKSMSRQAILAPTMLFFIA